MTFLSAVGFGPILGCDIKVNNQTYKDGNGMWMCAFGRCATKPVAFPNQKRLDKHKTCHTNAKCDVCGKIFSAKRNIVRHKKNVHESASTNSEGDGENGDRQDPLQQALESDNFIDMVIE